MIEAFYKLSSRRIGQRGDDPSAGAKLKAGPGVPTTVGWPSPRFSLLVALLPGSTWSWAWPAISALQDNVG